MSKFKVGDKVRVLSVPSVFKKDERDYMIRHYPSLDEVQTIGVVERATDGYDWYSTTSDTGFWFSDDSFEFATPSKRTILGLATELHALQLQLEEVRKQILTLSKEEDIDAEAW